jgi:hypothetical protein
MCSSKKPETFLFAVDLGGVAIINPLTRSRKFFPYPEAVVLLLLFESHTLVEIAGMLQPILGISGKEAKELTDESLEQLMAI